MSQPDLPPVDDQSTDKDDDTLPPEHPAGADAPVSAGEALSGEGMGTGKVGPSPNTSEQEPPRDTAPGDDS